MKTQSHSLSDTSPVPDLECGRILLSDVFSNCNLIQFRPQSVYDGNFLRIKCWAYAQQQVVYLLPRRTRAGMYLETDKEAGVISAARIFCEPVRD